MTDLLSAEFARLDAENDHARHVFAEEAAYARRQIQAAAEANRLAEIAHRRYIGRAHTYATQLRELADQLVGLAEPDSTTGSSSSVGHVTAAGSVIRVLTSTTAPMFTALMDLAAEADEARRTAQKTLNGGEIQ